MPDQPVRISALSEIADRYDGFLIDQWGVLHNGVDVHDAAIGALAALKSAGKKVVILSNSGRPGLENTRLMAEMGISPDLYDRVLSAGDDAYDALIGERDPDYQALGRNVLLLARDSDSSPLFDHGYTRVSRIEEADFLFLLSMEITNRFPEAWQEILAAAAARDLPLVCANPDFERVNGEGEILVAPGAVARHYEGLGGRSHWHGKPYSRIYRHAMGWMGLAPGRLLAIGDSLLHDVAGAQSAGIDSLFIINGIHRDRILSDDPSSLTREIAAFAPASPTWASDWLR